MSYDSKNLSVLAYANGFTMWHYATTDSFLRVGSYGYFNQASGMLRAGDVIIVHSHNPSWEVRVYTDTFCVTEIGTTGIVRVET